MAEEGNSSPLSSVLSSPPPSPPWSVTGDWNGTHAQETDTAAQVALEELAAEEPAVEEPAVEEPAVEELVVTSPAIKKPAARKGAAKKSAVDESALEKPAVKKPAVKKPAVKKPAVKKPAVKKPAVKKPAVKKPAVKKPAVKKPAVKKRSVKEPEVQGPEEPEEELATALAAPSASPENKKVPRPSNQPEPQELEGEASTSWTAINLPPRRLRSLKEPEVPTREEEAAAPSAAPSPVLKKRKSVKEPEVPTREEGAAAPSAAPSPIPKERTPLPEPVNSKQDVADSRNTLKPKLTRGACTPCRENKLKCLKEKPICSRCSESGTHCVYAFEQPRKGISAAARPALSKAGAVPADGGEPKALGSSNSHGDSVVQNPEVKKEVDIPEIGAAAVTDPLINGQDFKGLKNEYPSTVTKRARKNASGQTPEDAVLNGDAQSSRDTRRSESSGEQLDTEPRKRKASDQDKSSTAKRPRHAGAAPKKKNLDRKWEAPFVYTDENSPLTNADLRAILLLPQAWDVLTPEERKDILAKFPDDSHILDAGTENARPDLVSLCNNDHFRYDCARYLENIERGRHDEQWLQEAWVAHEKHKRGDYDDFLRKEFENDWATKIPEELLQKTSRKNEMLGPDATVAVSEHKAIANEQHKALPGRAKGASVMQEVPPASPASVDATEADGSVQGVTEGTQSIDHIAKHHPNGREDSNMNGAQYTELRFDVPQEAD